MSYLELPAEAREHIEELERGYLSAAATVEIEERGGPDGAVDYDVILAGGGLSLVYAAYLARSGLKVAVFDRRKIGCGHREWNISRRELQPLRDAGLFADPDSLIETEYARGIVRWHGGGTYPVRQVLDCVIDGDRLLASLREQAVQAGATLLAGHALTGYRLGKRGVEVRLRSNGGESALLTGKVLVDGMGAQSPHARYDLSCPTVGGVIDGLDEGDSLEDPLAVDPRVGEILVTCEDVEQGHQHIWEGFPRPGGFTTYLFYYCEQQRLGPRPLRSLYDRFFATLPRYKRGRGRVIKPTYGFIPAYSRLRPMPVAPRDRVLLVGDAAGRHSPLTFCGFGSMIRSFLPVADGLRRCLANDRLDRRSLERVWREPAGLGVMGGLTLMMVHGRDTSNGDPARINRLLDDAFASLAQLGEQTYAAFVRDEIGFVDFLTFMRRTAERHPGMYGEVFRQLSPGELARWSLRLATLGLRQWTTVSAP